MGVSILAGAITTIGSAVFLYGGVIVFFTKFATVILVTVFSSLLFSLIFFLAFLHACGPNDKKGNICLFFSTCSKKSSD